MAVNQVRAFKHVVIERLWARVWFTVHLVGALAALVFVMIWDLSIELHNPASNIASMLMTPLYAIGISLIIHIAIFIMMERLHRKRFNTLLHRLNTAKSSRITLDHLLEEEGKPIHQDKIKREKIKHVR